MAIIHFTNSPNKITLTSSTHPTNYSSLEVVNMKSYQGLFAQALYLAAMPLEQDCAQKKQAKKNEQQCSVEEPSNEKS
ncbi:hypothetical protein L2729_05405 [Shewanella gelidimarina]|uniref:hypothetical protein n=1 Tax=Shewanella gelidimarina TaxID=56813 RepID=UPI0020101B6E|nr:hypothetical protein [Shewanella gelidimarina]MCL1057431.1 hypothetical protein [Shewanella gelidimarina]